jgi:hypothetical protein
MKEKYPAPQYKKRSFVVPGIGLALGTILMINAASDMIEGDNSQGAESAFISTMTSAIAVSSISREVQRKKRAEVIEEIYKSQESLRRQFERAFTGEQNYDDPNIIEGEYRILESKQISEPQSPDRG